MDLHKLWDAAQKNFKTAFPGILLGALVTYLIYDSLVLSGKNSQISNLNAVVEVERGNQKVLDQRLKLNGDRVSFLNEQLVYKPRLDKENFEKLKFQVEKLSVENDYLQSLKAKFEESQGKVIDLVKLEVEVDRYISENKLLKIALSKYESDIIIKDFNLNQGQAWIGLGGSVSFGVGKVDYNSVGENFASATSTIFPMETKVIKAGQRFEFEIMEDKYYLLISSVEYIGSTVKISVYKI